MVVNLGEFTVESIKAFNLNLHITRHDFVSMRDQNDLPVLKFTLPKTKCEPVNGEEVQYAPETGCITDYES